MTPLKIRDYFNDIGCVFRLSAPVAIAAQLAVLLGCFSVACTNYGVDTAQESGSTDISSSFGKDVKLADVCKDVCKSEVKVVGDGAKSDGVVADNGPIDKENAADASDDVAIAACATPCAVDSDCPTTACNSASCKTGCCVFNAVVDGAICDDGVGCNGPDLCTAGLCSGGEADCSDKLDCTIDFCDDKSGNCKHTLKGEFCKIAGKCVATDGSNEYDKCQVCDPSLQDNAWSKKPGCCTQNSDCPNGSGCDLGTCDIDTATCKVVKKLGCCLTDAECDDGNLCTADSCDVVSGICTSKPKECPAPSACQKGTCSAKTGVCQGEITPGHCLIDSVCYNEADAQAKNGCKVCNPLLVKEDWSINVGAFCNDNNDCTAGDACNVAAACKGSPIPGCCKNDGDCPVAMEPCQTSKCNLALGLCAKIAKPNCCTVGVCCDVNAGVLKAAGTACADNVLSTEFKCNGATIQKRETVPGCNGTSNEGCSGNLAFVSVGGWVNVQICPANTQCTDVGGGILPSCKPIGPVGSCAGSCGGQSKNGSCFATAAARARALVAAILHPCAVAPMVSAATSRAITPSPKARPAARWRFRRNTSAAAPIFNRAPAKPVATALTVARHKPMISFGDLGTRCRLALSIPFALPSAAAYCPPVRPTRPRAVVSDLAAEKALTAAATATRFARAQATAAAISNPSAVARAATAATLTPGLSKQKAHCAAARVSKPSGSAARPTCKRRLDNRFATAPAPVRSTSTISFGVLGVQPKVAYYLQNVSRPPTPARPVASRRRPDRAWANAAVNPTTCAGATVFAKRQAIAAPISTRSVAQACKFAAPMPPRPAKANAAARASACAGAMHCAKTSAIAVQIRPFATASLESVRLSCASGRSRGGRRALARATCGLDRPRVAGGGYGRLWAGAF